MSFPSIAASASSTEHTALVTTHDVTLPSGINAGDLLLMFIALHNRTITPAEGWTILGEQLYEVGWKSAVLWKVADGTEGAATTFSASNSFSSHKTLRVTGHAAPDTLPKFVKDDLSTATTPDPLPLTPVSGSAEYLWLACIAAHNVTVNAVPTGYSAVVGDPIGITPSTYIAARNLEVSSENPGTFTLSHSRPSAVWTLAVSPFRIVVDTPTESFTLQGHAPIVDAGAVLVPMKGFGTQGHAPTISSGASVAVPAKTSALGGQLPIVASGASAAPSAKAFGRLVPDPTVKTGASVAAPIKILTIAGPAPSISSGVSVTSPATVCILARLAPAAGTGGLAPVPAVEQFFLAGWLPGVLSRAWIVLQESETTWTRQVENSTTWTRQ